MKFSEFINFRLASEHVRLLTGSPDTPMSFRVYDDTKRTRIAQSLDGTLGQCWPALVEAQERGCGVFVIPNEGGQTNAAISAVRALFVDADGVPMPGCWHRDPDFWTARDADHWHAYWCVEPGMPLDEFPGAQKRLAAHYGTDASINNLARVMRLAGTLHLKDPARPKPVTLVHEAELAALDWREIVDGLPEVAAKVEPAPAVPGVDLDTPLNLERARSVAIAFHQREGGFGKDDPADTYQIAARLKDLGISRQAAIDIMSEHVGDDLDWLAVTVGNAYRYGQNAPGSDAAELPSEDFADAAHHKGLRYPHHDPVDDFDLPPLSYLDADHMLPRVPGGCVVLVVGPKSNHKSGVVMRACVECIKSGLRVLFLATEDAHGIRTARLRAYQATRGMSDADLRNGWRTVPEKFNLHLHRDDLFASYGEWGPAVIVIDVALKSVPGIDPSSAKDVNAMMTAADDLAAKFGATVILTLHPSKGGAKEALGSTLFGDLAFAEWHVNKDAHGVRVWVAKMKNGPAEWAAHYELTSYGGVPVVGARVPDAEIKRQSVTADGPDPMIQTVIDICRDGVRRDRPQVITEIIERRLHSGIKDKKAAIATLALAGAWPGLCTIVPGRTINGNRYWFQLTKPVAE